MTTDSVTQRVCSAEKSYKYDLHAKPLSRHTIGWLTRSLSRVLRADEVYEYLVFPSSSHVAVRSLPGMADRTLRIGSAGKTFSLTAWKASTPTPYLAHRIIRSGRLAPMHGREQQLVFWLHSDSSRAALICAAGDGRSDSAHRIGRQNIQLDSLEGKNSLPLWEHSCDASCPLLLAP